MIVNRRLLRIELRNEPFDQKRIKAIQTEISGKFTDIADSIEYFVFSDTVSNNIYSPMNDSIKILYNNGDLVDITRASDILNGLS